MKQQSVKEYGNGKTSEMLDAVVFAMHEAMRLHNAEAVHRLRVSIRRFEQAIRVFQQYFSVRGGKKVRKDLKKIMSAAGELRNLDVATELLQRAGAEAPNIAERRAAARTRLVSILKRIGRKDVGVRWRNALDVS
jgi:CHAD domain-containing protein